MKKLITTTLLALAGITVLQTAVMAQFSPGDLILAFRNNSGTGTSGTDLEVDLGAASAFNFSLQNQTITQLSATELNSLYGNGGSFNTNANLVFSLVAANGTTLYLSDPSNANPPDMTAANLDANTTNEGIINGIYQVSGATQGANTSSLEVSPSNGQSYSNVIRNVDGNPYQSDYSFVTFEPSTEQGVSALGTTTALYKLTASANRGATPAAATELGTFTLEGNGTLVYDLSATPEPSTYALMGLGALALFFVGRRTIKA